MHGKVTTTDGLKITLSHGGEGDLVCLNGRLNIDSSPVLRDRLLTMLRGPSPKSIMLDLTEVSYIDVSGLATLIEGLKMARNRQTVLCLKGLQGRPLHLFEVTGLLALFEANGCKAASSPLKVS
jgi:anti-sigma B factor antagonist